MSRRAQPSLLVALVAVILALAGSLDAQEAPSEAKLPKGLDAMLARAMQSNPEVLLAQAQLEQARAELNQVRLKVTREVIEAHAHRQALDLRIQGVHHRVKEAEQLYTSGMLPPAELREAKATLIESEGEVTSTEARIRYLLGVGGMATVGRVASSDTGLRKEIPARRPPIPDRFAQALEIEIAIHFENVTLAALLGELSKVSGVVFLFHPEFGDREWTLSVDFGENRVPLSQILAALADLSGSACFAFRDYGILVVDQAEAMKMSCPVIPSTVPLRR